MKELFLGIFFSSLGDLSHCPSQRRPSEGSEEEAMVRPKPKRGERPRPKPGERRIDAAIDHFVELGFPKPLIRRVINDLLKVLPPSVIFPLRPVIAHPSSFMFL
jgi:hypothetical protein